MTHKRSITSIAVFDRALKRLKKPFPKVTSEVAKLSAQLEDGELMGDRIPNTPHELYKVRLPNPDAQKGKSGGFRVVYYLKTAEKIVLIIIYSKTEHPDMPLDILSQWIDDYNRSMTKSDDEE